MKEELEQLVSRLIKNLDKERNDRLVSFTDYKSKYTVLKPYVKVEVALTDGKVATFDITDYFRGVIK